MPIEQRTKGKLGSPGPFLAEITNHLDPTFMGGVEVAIIKGIPNSVKTQGETYVVKYLSPFYGVTSIRHEGTNASDFNDVQKSYGMWMVPPDIGTIVMVIFVDGDPNQGYWFGCVQDNFQNHMVPGIAATKQVNVTNEQRQKYGTDYLPTAEFHKGSQRLDNPNIDKIPKPVHPFADRLLAQGLLLDTTRGVTSSSARREIPSGVFGISTPGPLDTSPGAKKGKIGYEGNRQAPVSRLGGTTFVMDDGDVDGQNELVRIRTRTGHQILLHNSQDLVYIANSRGTAWIELSSDGKIDMYANDSVSIHTEADFNFRADRDINLEAGRNINVRAMGNMETNVSGYYFLVVDDHAKISIKNDKDETVGQTFNMSVGQDMNVKSAQEIKLTTGGGLDILATGSIKQTGSSIDLKASGYINQQASKANIKTSGNILMTAAVIGMNGPPAESAATATTAEDADVPPVLPIYSLPNRSTESGWANGNFYAANPIPSIMQRVPTHEPWDQHENINPEKFSKSATDASLQTRSGLSNNPAAGIQQSANSGAVTPGVCDIKFAKMINSSSSKTGIDALKEAAAELGLTTPYAVASLLAICGGESRWQAIKENFNYTAARLLQVFPSVFKGDSALASQYAGNPNNSLPEFLYGHTTSKGKGLGNTEAGDGAKFIGRGYIQLTGRGNYKKYSSLMFSKGKVSSATALIDNPDLLLDSKIAAQVSVLYLLDRCKAAQSDPGYFEYAARAVGYNTSDIYITKRGLYECFAAQLKGGVVGTGSGTILTTSDGTPVKTGVN